MQARGNPAVNNCIFRESSLSIGNADWILNIIFIKKTQFKNGFAYFHSRCYSNTIHSECTFENGEAKEKKFS